MLLLAFWRVLMQVLWGVLSSHSARSMARPAVTFPAIECDHPLADINLYFLITGWRAHDVKRDIFIQHSYEVVAKFQFPSGVECSWLQWQGLLCCRRLSWLITNCVKTMKVHCSIMFCLCLVCLFTFVITLIGIADWLHGLRVFFVFFGHVGFNLALCARLSWLLVSFYVHIKSLHIIITIMFNYHPIL